MDTVKTVYITTSKLVSRKYNYPNKILIDILNMLQIALKNIFEGYVYIIYNFGVEETIWNSAKKKLLPSKLKNNSKIA
jgi:hypothetical protein